MSKAVLKNTFQYGGGLLASRFLGLFRDVLIGAAFGLGFSSDTLLVLLTVPDFLSDFLLGAGIQLALVPYLQIDDPKEARSRFKKCFLSVFVLAALVGAAVLFYKKELIQFFLPSYSFEQVAGLYGSTQTSLMILLSSLMLLNSPLRAFLHAHKKFKVLGLENVCFNLIMVSGVAVYYFVQNITVLIVFVFMSFFSRSLWLLYNCVHTLKTNDFTDSPLNDENAKLPLADSLFSSIFTSFLILGPILLRSYSNTLGEGWVTSFVYANRIVEMALMVFITILGSIVFSELPAQIKANKDNVLTWFGHTFLWFLPLVAFTGYFLMKPLMAVAGDFKPHLMIFTLLALFIPIRLFLYYYNLILMASKNNKISGFMTLLAGLISYLIYTQTEFSTSVSSLLNLQAILFYPLAFLFALYLLKTSKKLFPALSFLALIYLSFHLFENFGSLMTHFASIIIVCIFSVCYLKANSSDLKNLLFK